MAHLKTRAKNDRPARLLKALATSKTGKEAAIKAGYAKSTAEKAIGYTIDRAIETVSNRAINGDKTALALLENLGKDSEDIRKLWEELAFRSKNDSVRLQAATPVFEAVLGLNYSKKDETPSAPTLVIGVQTPNNGPVEPYTDVESA